MPSYSLHELYLTEKLLSLFFSSVVCEKEERYENWHGRMKQLVQVTDAWYGKKKFNLRLRLLEKVIEDFHKG